MPDEYTAFIKWVDELSKFYHLDMTSFNQPKDIKERVKQYGYALITQAIIGEAELVDVVRNSKDVFAIQSHFHWVLKNPVMYDNPIMNVLGKLKLWEYDVK